jgi:VIT1/CCC1 family predicted Fe2+/Mn2+ transporter
MPEESTRSRRGRLSERVSAASYGTVLVLVSFAAIDVDAVDSGLGWELVTGVGVATWVAHLYAEVVGDHLRYDAPLDRREIAAAAIDGIPIIVAAVLPAVVLLLGRLGILDSRVALWTAVAVAIAQLVALGAFVGHATARNGRASWAYAAVTGAIGVAVVALKLALGH